jgi:surface protein
MRNVHKKEFDFLRLPDEALTEDRGYSFCSEPYLVLADPLETTQWKNDIFGVAGLFDSMTVELERQDGTLETALGAVVTMPKQPNATGFIIDWRTNLIAYGPGCYRVKVTWDIQGITGFYYAGNFELMPYSLTASEGTVQLIVNYDDKVLQDGINYTGSGFYTGLRFKGFFGNEQINSEHRNLLKANNVRQKVRNFSAPSYDLVTRPLTRCFTRPLKRMLLNASDIWVSDYNAWNHEIYRYFNVILSDAEGVEMEGNETFVRQINATLLDKLWTTESKYDLKEAQPPQLSELFSLVCPSGSFVNIEVNGTPEGSVAAGSTLDVNLTDGTNPVTPDDVTLVGNTLTIEVGKWVRPADWLAMPTVLDTDDTFVSLHAIFPSGQNYVAFRFTTDTGDYEIDWGDGNVDVVASNVVAEHEYDYSTYDPTDSTLTTRGYKQAIITVTPVTGQLATANFQFRFTTTPAQNQAYATGLLDCILSMPNANIGQSIIFGGVTVNHRFVERFQLLNLGNVTNIANMFNNCSSLQSVPLFDTSGVTNMANMFQTCASLQSVPLFDTSGVTTMNSMFNNCTSLQSVPLFDTSSVTIMNTMFQNCSSLQSVPLFDTSGVTTMNLMFNNCTSIQSVPLFDTSGVTIMSSMFNGCRSFSKTDIVCPVSVSFENCQLSRAELVNIFNNLVDRTSTTSANINISSNWGATALTTAERDIALNKNWTITG